MLSAMELLYCYHPIGMALGYPDWDSPVNHFERERADPDEIVTWVS